MGSSFIQPGTIKAIAETVDVTGLSDEAAKALAPDVEYRLREVIQASLAGAAGVLVLSLGILQAPKATGPLVAEAYSLSLSSGCIEVCAAQQAHQTDNRGHQQRSAYAQH